MSEQKHKLLVIDDSDLIRKAIVMLLDGEDYEVRVAATIAEFDELLAEWWPDTILSDVQMPDMTGDELCRGLKSRLLVRVILFSNLPPNRLAELAVSSGADGYISKLEGFAELPNRLTEIVQATQPRSTTDTYAGPGRILLLDDSELGREVTGTVLARAGFDVRIAGNLKEVSDSWLDWDPQVVLTVPTLQHTEEGEVCRLLKAQMSEKIVPIVFFGEDTDAKLVDLARRSGADDALSKLEGFDRLFKKLHELCNRQQS